MRRGDLWLADVGGKLRPVLVLTRDEVIDVRTNVTVAEVSTSVRGLAVEVPVGSDEGLDGDSVVNCDGVHTVAQRRLVSRLGVIDDDTMQEVCAAVAAAIGCDGA